MQRNINKLFTHLMNGEISQQEFIQLLKKDLYQIRREDRDRLLEKN